MGNIFSPMATFPAMAHEKNPMAQIIFPWPKKKMAKKWPWPKLIP